MNRKILVVLAVLAIALAVAAVSIEAQRGGGSRGGGSGGSGGGMHPEPNVNDNTNGNFPPGNYDTPTGGCGNFNGNYELPPGNYGPGNYEALDVCVSTDKRIYTEDEPIEVEVKAYNPTTSTITLEFTVGSRDNLGCQAYYTIDGTDSVPEWTVCNAAEDEIPIPSGGSYSWGPFTHPVSVFPVTVGMHSVVGIVDGTGFYLETDPITIKVVESN